MCPEQNLLQVTSKKKITEPQRIDPAIFPPASSFTLPLSFMWTALPEPKFKCIYCKFTSLFGHWFPMLSLLVFMQERFSFQQTIAYSPSILICSLYIFPIHLYPILCTSLSTVFMLPTWVLISGCLSSIQTQCPALSCDRLS